MPSFRWPPSLGLTVVAALAHAQTLGAATPASSTVGLAARRAEVIEQVDQIDQIDPVDHKLERAHAERQSTSGSAVDILTARCAERQGWRN